MKFIWKSDLGRKIIPWTFHKFVSLSYCTSKIFFEDATYHKQILKSQKPLIFAFWHGRMCFMPFLLEKPENTYVLISRHGDGALIAKVMDYFKMPQVRGSTSGSAKGKKTKDRGGSIAFRECLELIAKGKNIAITPDGPRGPRMRAQAGAIHLAKLSGAEIIPVTYSTSCCKIFKSWDRFMLPLPFGKAFVYIGQTIKVPNDADDETLEKTRIELENQLNKITRSADKRAGIEIVEPEKIDAV